MKTFSGWQYWTLTILGLAAVVMVLVDMALYQENRTLQTEVAQRQREINQAVRLSRLNNQLIRSLAAVSARTGDTQIRDLLAAQGITFNLKAKAATEASPVLEPQP